MLRPRIGIGVYEPLANVPVNFSPGKKKCVVNYVLQLSSLPFKYLFVRDLSPFILTMPNRSPDELFQLIHTLEKAEKRNFKLFVRRNASSEEKIPLADLRRVVHHGALHL